MIVTGGDESPYVAASEAAQKVLTGQGHSVKTVKLDDCLQSLNVNAKQAELYLAVGTKAAAALHEQIKSPSRLVYCLVAHPEAAGLSTGAPVCGVSTDAPADAQIKLMSQALPGLKTIGLLYCSGAQGGQERLASLRKALPKGVLLTAVAVDKAKSPADAIESLLEQKPDVVRTLPDPAVYNAVTVRALLLNSIRKGVPVFGYSASVVKAGALLGVSVDPRAEGEQAAKLAMELLAKPAPTTTTADTHGILPPRLQVVVNLIVAKRLSLTLPADLVTSADIVFKPEEDNQ